MSVTARWIVGIAGLLFALTAFIPVTVSAHVWTAVLFGAVIGVTGFEAARRNTSWLGALLTLAGLWILTVSFVGSVQTGAGHMWVSLITGLTVVGLTIFVRDEAVRV